MTTAPPKKALPDEVEFSHRGWRFRWRCDCPIAGAAALEALTGTLRVGNIPLPEMTYADHFLEVHHPASGFSLRFSALGALRSWHALQLASAQPPGSPVDVTNCDFTFTTEYDGEATRAGFGGGSAGSDGEWRGGGGGGGGGTSCAFRLLAGAPAASALPLALLSERQRILAFAQVPLFASDLNDRGVVEVEVKLRITEGYAFLRCTAFTRLDGGLTRARDARFFVDFDAPGAPRVMRDVQLRVGTVAEVVAAAAAAAAGEEGAGEAALPAGLPSFFRAAPPASAPPPAAAPPTAVTAAAAVVAAAATLCPGALPAVPEPAAPASPRLQLRGTEGRAPTLWPARPGSQRAPPPPPAPARAPWEDPPILPRLAVTAEDVHAALAPSVHVVHELLL
jgi:hypothetical protein